LDLSGFDLVVSSSHCVAKGVRLAPGILHLAYIHAPMRYMWDQFDAYFGRGRASWPVRWAALAMRGRLQRWDRESNSGITLMVANSRFTAQRIKAYYGRQAEVVYPPVEVDRFRPSERDDGFYLVVSALVPYKRVDTAILALRQLAKPLKIIGEGPERRRLERLARGSAEFLGWQPEEVVREYYARCRAVVFPGEEDFGMVPVEAMASGKAVIALGRGGATETVKPLDPLRPDQEATGVWSRESTPEALAEAIRLFEAHREAFPPARLAAHARSFDRQVFKSRMRALVASLTRALTHA